jgi:hypothetical protein
VRACGVPASHRVFLVTCAGGGEGMGLYLEPQFNLCCKCDKWWGCTKVE